MLSKDVRNAFIDFFKDKGHSFVPSSPLVLGDDPTLLFVNAGMNQFKQIFLGNEEPKHKRVVNSQKCLRVSGKHNDLEDVGYDTYHHTFFEMLGNWSFGDYYKEEAIAWAWELFTKVLKLPKDRLYATVYKTDDEAFSIWEKMDIDRSHILRFGEKENFWEMGNTGPCGPCSEIHIDLGYCLEKDKDHECGVNKCGRFVELWNLVFIQYNREDDGSLTPLKSKHVDTGAGLERLTAVLQGKTSNYDTDLFKPILDYLMELSGKKYDGNDAVAMRVIADHIRALVFSIADGVTPSNEGRGYVIRRILRRAYRYGHKLGFKEPFLYKIADIVKDIMAGAYILDNIDTVKKLIKVEEEKFAATLEKGLGLFDQIAGEVKDIFPGDKAFILYDTYGFPIDLTNVLCRERGIKLDEDGFNKCMDEQRERARSSGAFEYDKNIDFIEVNKGETTFVGYDTLVSEARVLKYSFLDNNRVAIVIDKTPFYAESGGQVGDKGVFRGKKTEVYIYDVKKIGSDYVHFGEVKSFSPDDVLSVEVDFYKRKSTERNHTATHLLHKALRIVLGEHVRQSGSLVDENRLRFDFSHFSRMSDDEIKRVEDIVNDAIFKALKVETIICGINEAKSMGAMALFGEKYGDTVRVVKSGDFSIELCGGTHVKNTSEIGIFKIVSESSVASGIRRIEAVTSFEAYKLLSTYYNGFRNVISILNATPENVVEKVESLIKENKKLKKGPSGFSGNSDIKPVFSKDGLNIYIEKLNVQSPKELLSFNDMIKSKDKRYISIIIGDSGDKIYYLCSTSSVDIKAKDISELINKKYNGRGGGKDIIQGVIESSVSKDDILELLKNFIK
ncbi:MAG TPA: alanine--tRNA ligase [Spirochaetota bacterium]|nr:alanine--tRNA ligase [Spirochaetota bacterium]HOM38647.1 alanine--tRNA ligase [Spirochaetota bacterium]HPQ49837.1 alanine--tRNA ligase [Spirochaetota bacterium]